MIDINDKVKLIGKLFIEDTFRSLSEWRASYDINEQEQSVLYQYTTLESCANIIISEDIWLFDSRHCNDEQEYKNGLNFVKSSLMESNIFKKFDFPIEDDLCRHEYDIDTFNTVSREIENRFHNFNSDWLCYVACFSRPISNYTRYRTHLTDDLLDNDNLVMWRGYGNEAKGGCLGFNHLSMEHQTRDNPNCLLVEVLYDVEDKSFFIKCLFRTIYELFCNNSGLNYGIQRSDNLLELRIEKLVGNYDVNDLFLGLAYALHLVPSFFKHAGFEAEREFRLIHSPEVIGRIDSRVSYLGSGKDARPYIPLSSVINNLDLPIINLTLGSQVSDKDFHDSLFKSGAWGNCNANDIALQHSLIPYRS
ncbi:DUF2971 domain-containing protein [Vibrio caribbeanicus]|uniref:DUF2971 domain-containing protein n=1 Tax=Vibrio caribbeanicus TaxID=701175 RepID=UPI0022833153|nr:DUF2971 domain-containing protein [Vibrio caribbeanicus]MCY9844541.1 DUF2971 domain-containing protein [Vibrio caribbeanicus]